MLTFKRWVERAAIANATLLKSFRAIHRGNTKENPKITVAFKEIKVYVVRF